MIASLFLLFVAFGILIGSIIVGFGSFGAIAVGLAGGTAVTGTAAYALMKRRATS